MPTVKVYYDSPGKGPGHAAANAALLDIRNTIHDQNATVTWNADQTTYTSNVATRAALIAAVAAEFPNYHIV